MVSPIDRVRKEAVRCGTKLQPVSWKVYSSRIHSGLIIIIIIITIGGGGGAPGWARRSGPGPDNASAPFVLGGILAFFLLLLTPLLDPSPIRFYFSQCILPTTLLQARFAALEIAGGSNRLLNMREVVLKHRVR